MRRCCVGVLVLFALLIPRAAAAYGVLAHEAIIDAVWDRSISPILESRFHPSADELTKARAFAYGGCLIQDLGYYPFSSRTFGDLTHYVRSGDFVIALLKEASNIDEYAFALGALAHYAGDNIGHPLGVNRSVPLLYPKLRAKFGDVVTYEDNRSAHLKTEFGFDVVQIARGAYLPASYHDFVGFEVSKPVMDRAFRATYGLALDDVFGNLDMAVGTFRYTVSTMIPQMTKVAWQTKEKEIRALTPAITRERFLFSMPRGAYEKEYGTKYNRPGFGSKFLAFVLRIVPKIGPFASLAFKPPTPEAERLFLQSFETTVAKYRGYLATLAKRQMPSLENLNFDTGQPAAPGEYRLADEAQKRLAEKLRQQQSAAR